MAKISTKRRILNEALQQLNTQGVNSVTVRSVAEALSISPGNLSYHFKNIDTIVYELYLELVMAIDRSVFALANRPLDLYMMYEQQIAYQNEMFRYRFVLLEFATIARRVEAVKIHYRQLIQSRIQQMKLFVQVLVEGGYFREMSEEIVLVLIHQSMIFSNAWLIDGFLHFEQPDEQMIPFYARLQIQTLEPYLTEKGKEQYREIISGNFKDAFEGY